MTTEAAVIDSQNPEKPEDLGKEKKQTFQEQEDHQK